ncbi:hypothetical protein GSI_11490 [Ganoderma sinense ZZ0214-1]|uniref:Uncharacterized protein n=1 Tax=Ganoderma sinense ZZ0214-1 TaxID=1077348 RepID=A0A2G8RW49_9APHY|nr:hypothetical protein GSI_11490 [Ganoderma sinense ZZ0214-1]
MHLQPSTRTVFQNLGAALAQCSRLQHVLIGFVHEDTPGDDPIYRPETFVHLLTNLPLTIRTIVFRIRVLRLRPWPDFLAGAVSGLSTADILLAPWPDGGQQSPELERVELRVIEHATTKLDRAASHGTRTGSRRRPSRRRGPEAHDPSLLPLLHAAGMLRFVHEVEDIREQLPPPLRSLAVASSLFAEFETSVRLC